MCHLLYQYKLSLFTFCSLGEIARCPVVLVKSGALLVPYRLQLTDGKFLIYSFIVMLKQVKHAYKTHKRNVKTKTIRKFLLKISNLIKRLHVAFQQW